jgi:GntR family transcriptional repressor for pyruvate dehydrogenase complex
MMAENRIADPNLFRSPLRKSTVDTVIDRIKQLLITQQLKPGDRLPNEMELTKRLSASRGSIREAMKVLSSFGILEIRRGDGTYVSDSTGQKVFDHLLFQVLLSKVDKQHLIELRALLELGMARIIVSEAGPADLENIRASHERMRAVMDGATLDPDALTEADIDFHKAFAAATGNVLLERIYDFTLELFQPSIRRTHEREDRNAFTLHEDIIEGLEKRDLAATIGAINRSLDRWNALS